jgi:hypothetical protein
MCERQMGVSFACMELVLACRHQVLLLLLLGKCCWHMAMCLQDGVSYWHARWSRY